MCLLVLEIILVLQYKLLVGSKDLPKCPLEVMLNEVGLDMTLVGKSVADMVDVVRAEKDVTDAALAGKDVVDMGTWCKWRRTRRGRKWRWG